METILWGSTGGGSKFKIGGEEYKKRAQAASRGVFICIALGY